MPYLMIQNPVKSVPSIELMRLLGASSSRGNAERIGQFGSGFPYSLALLARYGLLEGVKVCLGKDVYTFELERHNVKDSGGRASIRSEIRMRKQNGASWDMGIDVEFGKNDWTDVRLAVREFVSNAIDGVYEFGGMPSQDVVLKSDIPDEGRMTRAADGFVRIYIPVNEDIIGYVDDLPKYFRCLQPGYDPNRLVWLNTDGGPARIYRKGVLVGSYGERSLFHYNVNDIQINESRQVDRYTAREECARAIMRSKSPMIISKYINHVVTAGKPSGFFENDLYVDYMSSDHVPAKEREEITNACKVACNQTIGHKIVCTSPIAARMVEGKGMETVLVESNIATMLDSYGAIKDASAVLNHNELSGRIISEATPAAKEMVDKVWSVLENHNFTLGKPKPPVACFVQTISEGGMLGYYRPGDGLIYLRRDEVDGITSAGMTTVLHELNHYITGAEDYTYEFVDFAHRVAVALMMDK